MKKLAKAFFDGAKIGGLFSIACWILRAVMKLPAGALDAEEQRYVAFAILALLALCFEELRKS